MILQIVLLVLLSCNQNKKRENNSMDDIDSNKDKFYTVSHYQDLIRLPLIKPYEIYSADNGFTWFLKFRFPEKIRKKDELGGVDSIGVHDNLIVAYSKLTYLPGEMTPAWFIVDVPNKDEKVFTKEKEYKDYLTNRKLESVKFYRPKEVFEKFEKSGKLPW
jgi:hypothetical protein